jgi:hypothetical protein
MNALKYFAYLVNDIYTTTIIDTNDRLLPVRLPLCCLMKTGYIFSRQRANFFMSG